MGQLAIMPSARATGAEVDALLYAAIGLEDAGDVLGALKLYREALVFDSRCVTACINVGNIFYRQRRWDVAESLFRRATEVDPSHAMALFNLANALEELRRAPEAIEAYRQAAELGYVDAHYNLALAFEHCGDRRSALKHWSVYVKSDPGRDGLVARQRIKSILRTERLQLVRPA